VRSGFFGNGYMTNATASERGAPHLARGFSPLVIFEHFGAGGPEILA